MNRPREAPVTAGMLLDRPQDGLFKVARAAFTDAALFDAEMRHIFEGTWVYLCHESQIPAPHDYFATRIGRQPVFATRNAAGEVRAFINACAHRGAVLCRTARGNRKFHVCPYHGWAYDSDGRNVEIKDRDSGGYPPAFAQASHDLTPVPRVASYRGFVFASLNADVPPLEAHLGPAAALVDCAVDQSPDGLEVLPGGSVYTHQGNWKVQPENGIDGYHAPVTHANYFNLIRRGMERWQRQQAGSAGALRRAQTGVDFSKLNSGWYDLGRGHALMWLDFPMPQARPAWAHREEITARCGEGRAAWMLGRQRNLLIYPNLLVMDHISTQIRVIQPRAVDQTAVQIFCIGAVGESVAERALRIRQYEDFYNASGLATPDDLANFESCDAGFHAASMPWVDGYERGLAHRTAQPDAYAAELGITPLAGGPNCMDETLLHSQYREWRRLLAQA
jgi:benzoate/toluate 1,2-dioxygenase subunit alpha